MNAEHRLIDIFNTDNVDVQVGIFNNVFNVCFNKCAPLVRKEIKRLPARWINEELRAFIKSRNNTQKLLKKDRDNIIYKMITKLKKNNNNR